MTCEQAIEILPWYLNGTLEAKEQEEVRHHLGTCEACRQALAETRDAWRIFDQHLPSEALVALAWGETPAGIDSTLAERHLAACPQCAADLELARTSRHLEEDDRIALFRAKPATVAPREARGDGESRTWRKTALAASLAAVVAMSGWIFSAQQAPREDEVVPNVLVVTLSPLSEIERSGEEDDALRAGSPVTLLLTPEAGSGADTYETFEAEVRGPGGDLVFQIGDLHLQEDGDFSLALPSGFREPGRYEIRVFGLRDGQRGERVGEYQVTAR